MMKAAVVSSFEAPPRYQDFPDPVPAGDDDLVVDVLAAGLHPRVRCQADGAHYTSTDELPREPGVAGSGRGPGGLLPSFFPPDPTLGAMAEQTVIDPRRSIVLPAGSDPVAVAAAMNPAMSSWVALRQRIPFQPGQDVLVLGATGNAGQLAIQIAKLSGADRIIAAGRNAERLAMLPAAGATGTVCLDGDPQVVARRLRPGAPRGGGGPAPLWGGAAAAAAMIATIPARPARAKPLTWIEIGSIAGPAAPVPSAALRAARLTLVGSGQGSGRTREDLGAHPPPPPPARIVPTP